MHVTKCVYSKVQTQKGNLKFAKSKFITAFVKTCVQNFYEFQSGRPRIFNLCSRPIIECYSKRQFTALFVRSHRKHAVHNGNGSPYSITKRRVPEPIPVLGSQPAGDVSLKPDCRLRLLSARPAVTPATLKRAATNFTAW